MINAAFVRECKARAKMYEVTCDALPGFILRVLPTGKKVALVRYRVAGKDHRERIGLLGPSLTIDEARRRAAIMLASVAADESDDETSSQPVRATRPCGTGGTAAVSDRHAPRARRALHPGALDVRLKPGTAERYRQLLATSSSRTAPRRTMPPLGDRDFRSVRRPRSTRCTPDERRPARRTTRSPRRAASSRGSSRTSS
jgi:hypothetical protein